MKLPQTGCTNKRTYILPILNRMTSTASFCREVIPSAFIIFAPNHIIIFVPNHIIV